MKYRNHFDFLLKYDIATATTFKDGFKIALFVI